LNQLIFDSTAEDKFLVKFYAKWCSFSQQLEPVYNSLPKVFPQLNILSLDASKYNSLNFKYGIYGFPRILLFTGQNITRYNGNRTFESLVEFIKENTKIEPNQNFTYKIPVIKLSNEGDIYLYLSSIFIILLFIYSIYSIWLTRSPHLHQE